ncbi:hypothetical protein SCATT_p16250 (plasmid) [Streptantibioticus cattleyicolor NRRL 8057 = DSM 46488]|uniref:Uncharacterized protein n=1 Tax=Streptantibioticus cattleyicolor (strain ATCC 35852 / DSM 46488 / JCM 4925 / NBRC 14057 / NRRL 8057) TaxID=1003195 RepID=G8XHI1_STREN|nr:hypothetical protein SCATT_p16250 [Streptantibioticus cattleyicolor NRRL 8057 = DSM 46488]
MVSGPPHRRPSRRLERIPLQVFVGHHAPGSYGGGSLLSVSSRLTALWSWRASRGDVAVSRCPEGLGRPGDHRRHQCGWPRSWSYHN